MMEKVLSQKLNKNLEARFRLKEVKQKMAEKEERGRRELMVAEWAEFLLRNKDVQQDHSVGC